VHWVGDTLAGALLSCVFVYLVVGALERTPRERGAGRGAGKLPESN
jgi:hypothetical protein